MSFQYSAFISYSWADEKWAKWLQQKLETYRLPSVMLKSLSPEGNGRLRVFRDKTDMKQGSQDPTVKGSLMEKMSQSQFLIVICSDNVVSSQYVNFEIESFIAMGRGDHIIPFVVSGETDHKNIPDTFPPALRALSETEKSPLAFSVSDVDKHTAFVKVVATLLNLDALTLLHREKLRRRRRLILRCSLAATLFAVMVLAAVGLYDYYVPHTAYYLRAVERWGMPVGVGELKQSEMERLSEHYRITVYKSEDKTVLLRCNSAGELQPKQNTKTIPDYAEYYHPDGKPVTVTYKDSNHNITMVGTYNRDLSTMDFTDINNQFQLLDTVRYVPDMAEDTEYLEYHNNITREVYEYDEESGAKTKVLFMAHSQNIPAPLSNGVYGIEFVRSDDGNTETEYYLNKDGERAPNTEGVSGIRTVYQNNKEIEFTSFLITDKGETPTYSRSAGAITIQYAYDDNGNCSQVDYLDENGSPYTRGLGYTTVYQEYDSRGYLCQESYYDADDNPAIIFGSGNSIIKIKHNDKGQVIEYAYFDTEGQPTYSNSARHCKRFIRDEWGNIIELTFYGTDSETRVNGSGKYSKAVYQYDETGTHLLSSRPFDDQDIPCYNSTRVHEYRYHYDGDKRTSVSYYDVDGNPTYNSKMYASGTYTYDDLGNINGGFYYDAEGKLCYSDDGYVGYEYIRNEEGTTIQTNCYVLQSLDSEEVKLDCSVYDEYDDKGNVSQRKYISGSEIGADARYGFTTVKYLYNERGELLGEAYYDEKGNPSMVKGYASYRIEKESEYKQIKTFYNESGSPMDISEGYAQVITTYTLRGSTLSEAYYNALGEPVLTTDGYAKISYTYNERNRQISKSYHDINGALVNIADGYASVHYEYDQFGRTIAYTYFDEQGNPTINSGYSASRLEMMYNERGQEIQRIYYDTDGKYRSEEGQTAITEYEYDAKGNIVRYSYLNDKHQFVANDTNVDQSAYVYNRKNNKIEYAAFWLDADGNWRDHAGGYAFAVTRYKDDGTEESRTTYTAAEMNAGEYDAGN